jgi:hypothetical protein
MRGTPTTLSGGPAWSRGDSWGSRTRRTGPVLGSGAEDRPGVSGFVRGGRERRGQAARSTYSRSAMRAISLTERCSLRARVRRALARAGCREQFGWSGARTRLLRCDPVADASPQRSVPRAVTQARATPSWRARAERATPQGRKQRHDHNDEKDNPRQEQQLLAHLTTAQLLGDLQIVWKNARSHVPPPAASR